MPFHLDHTVVPARDKEASARFFARIFGLEYTGPWGPFAPVKVDEHLSMDFDDRRQQFTPMHYAFITSEDELDAALERVKQEGIPFGSGPGTPDDGEINHLHGGRGFYFKDPNGHLLEIITHTYV
jgi:catechol 2,3-dioxygenase-like lactoylglutathione lyase family enzyme